MRIGRKVTVKFARKKPFPFLRCYVIRRLPQGWQLYDPIRDWSWGLKDEEAGKRVLFPL